MACFCSAATSQRRALRSTTPSLDVAAILWRCRYTRTSIWRRGGEEGNITLSCTNCPRCVALGAGGSPLWLGQPVVVGAAAVPARAGRGGRRCHKMAVLCAALLGRRGKRPRGSKAALRGLRAPRGPPGAAAGSARRERAAAAASPRFRSSAGRGLAPLSF